MSEAGKWCFSFNEEDFQGNYDTKYEAIEVAKDYIDDEKVFWIGQTKEVSLGINIDYILDDLNDQAYQQVNYHADDFLHDVTDEHHVELEEQLNKKLLDWIYKYYKPNFYSVKNIEMIKI